ncbi:MAG: hypothetical protein WCJ95_18820 [Mariniphaga sp.]
MKKFNSQKISKSLFAAIIFISTLFIYGPILIYQGNIAGFGFSLQAILLVLLIPFFLAFILLTGFGLILPGKAHQRYVVIISCISILFWIQGTFIIWKLGVLDGSSIDWTKYKWQGLADSAVWIILLGIAITNYRYWYRFLNYIVIFIILSEAGMICVISVQRQDIWTQKTQLQTAPPKEIFQFSGKTDILHIVLDQFGSSLFKKVLLDNKEYSSEMDGFTFFKEVITTTPVTYISVPSFLSGQTYTNKISVNDFYRENYEKGNIQFALASNGYDIDIMSQPEFLKKRDIDKRYYNIPTPYNVKTTTEFNVYKAGFLLDLVLFRFVPYHLKFFIYNDQSWFISSFLLSEKYSKFEHFSANEFLADFTNQASVARSMPVYKYIHLMTPHPPLVVKKNSKHAWEALPVTNENFKYQAEYSFKTVISLLEKMKSLNIYNSTLIIIHADHGCNMPFEMESPEGKIVRSDTAFKFYDSFLPLLLIKTPGAHGALLTSGAQCELNDLPATISSVLKMQTQFPGKSLYSLDPSADRVRKGYLSNTTQRNDAMVSGFFDELQEYTVSGSVFKINSWTKGQIFYKAAQKYQWGTTLKFNDLTDMRIYLESGWGYPESDHIWNNGNKAIIKLPITEPKSEFIELKCEVSPFLVPAKGLKNQKLIISINSSQVGEFILSEPGGQTIKLTFPKKLLANSSDLSVGFNFPNAVLGSKMGINGEIRVLGCAFYTVSLSESTSK